MMKSKRFEPVREIADHFAASLSRGVAEAKQQLEDAERQLQQLHGYRDDYVKRSAQGSGTIDAVRMQNYRSFIDRLSEAIRAQAETVTRARDEHERRRTEWQEKRVEAEVLGKAVERFKGEERRAADRKEQYEIDERALQRRVDHT